MFIYSVVPRSTSGDSVELEKDEETGVIGDWGNLVSGAGNDVVDVVVVEFDRFTDGSDGEGRYKGIEPVDEYAGGLGFSKRLYNGS